MNLNPNQYIRHNVFFKSSLLKVILKTVILCRIFKKKSKKK
jgi:hypothetical protein